MKILEIISKNKIISLAVVIVLLLVVALIFTLWKNIRGDQNQDQPDEPGEVNFPPNSQEQPNAAVEKTTPSRDKKGRFIKKVVSR